ncbi:MAG: carbon-nitrogen hydrolase family protein [Burkholderiales bacterium]
MDKSVVAAVQMVSTPVVQENLDTARRLVHAAAGQGARFVVLPEYFCILGMNERDKLAVRERDGDGPIQACLADIARQEQVWLVGGSVPIATGAPDKVRSACLVYDDRGERVARYDKIHLFGFESGNERYRESNTIEPGTTPLAIDTPFGRVALTICYDVRFPELYRSLGPVDMILVPSAFTATTGRAHWEVLLRARAIENQAYVLAPAQGGRHPNGRETHGHTMIVDPWGVIMTEQAIGEAVLTATVDPAEIQRVRSALPALDHRRF